MARFLAFLHRVYQGYVRNGGGLTAAAISYYALVSIIPLLLLAISIFGFVLSSSRAYDQTVEFVRLIVPWRTNTVDIESTLSTIASNSAKTGVMGIVVLLWTGSQFFHVLEDALNRTWDVQLHRPFWKGRLVALLLMVLAGATMALSLILGISAQWVESRNLPVIRHLLLRIPFHNTLVAYTISLLCSVAMFTLIYRITPNARVSVREAFVGGLLGGVLWDLAKVAFGYYVAVFAGKGYSKIYGSLGGAFLLVLWVYYTANIFVIGGEFARWWCEWYAPIDLRKRLAAGGRRLLHVRGEKVAVRRGQRPVSPKRRRRR